MDSKTIDKIVSDAKLEILEEKLSLLRSNTTKTYSDILSAYLSSMD